MNAVTAKIIANQKIKGSYWRVILHAPQVAQEAIAGQFVQIKLTQTLSPLLRRPFSLHAVSGSGIEIIYEVLGEGTRLLCAKGKGEPLDIIGPLGNGFCCQKEKNQIIIAGGMGVAPLAFLAQKIAKYKPLVLLGAVTKNKIICAEEFKKLGLSVRIATDDGSVGFRGRVTDLLTKLLSVKGYCPSNIYACGPQPMLKAVAGIAQESKIPAQLSLEEHMACGIGACLGCVVETKDGLKRVCKEGPVFNARDLIWQRQ